MTEQRLFAVDAPAKRPSFWDAVGLTLHTCGTNARRCLLFGTTFAVLAGIGNAVARSVSLVTDPAISWTDQLGFIAGAMAAFMLLTVVYVIVFPLTVGALSLLGSAAVYGDEVSGKGVLRQTIDHGANVVGAFLLTVLLLAIAPVLLGLAAVVVGYFWSDDAGFAVLLFSLVVLVIPSFYVLVRLSLAVPVVMRESVGPITALRRSWELVHGAWWWIFGVGVVVALLAGIISVGASFSSLFGADSLADFVVGAIVSALGALIAISLFGVAAGVSYAARAPEDLGTA